MRFQVCLDQVTQDASTEDLWAAAARIFGGRCSDDGFCYFGLWMVGLGREAFERALADPDALADAPEVQRLAGRPRDEWNDDWPEWELLDYVALEAYERAAGGAEDGAESCEDAFDDAVEARRLNDEGGRDPVGGRGEVGGGGEAALGLPRLSRLFPLPAGA